MKKSNLTDYPNYRVSKRGKIIRLSDGKVIKCYLNHRFSIIVGYTIPRILESKYIGID